MTPVDMGTMRSGAMFISSAAWFKRFKASRIPRSPVTAFALPELSRIAWHNPVARAFPRDLHRRGIDEICRGDARGHCGDVGFHQRKIESFHIGRLHPR